MTDDELAERLSYWQGVLRLRDWDINARMVSAHEMEAGSEGRIDPKPSLKEADIKILNWEGYGGTVFRPLDSEQILVHELLHLFFLAFDTREDSAERLEEEQAVHLIAKALVALDRKHDG
jgi:hypothetical protein